MGKRGPKPKGKVKIKWSPDFAYAVGLLVSDGNLSPDGRHIIFSSKDIEMAHLFQKALDIQVYIGKKSRGVGKEKKYHVVQFSDVRFYLYLQSIGIMPNKSKVIGRVNMPSRYFFDFLRGLYDGDGCTYAYFDKRWKSSFMFYTVFVSASETHIQWLREEIYKRLKIKGHITKGGKKRIFQLRYAKKDSMRIFSKMYQKRTALFLSRKKLKIDKILRTIGAHQ